MASDKGGESWFSGVGLVGSCAPWGGGGSDSDSDADVSETMLKVEVWLFCCPGAFRMLGSDSIRTHPQPLWKTSLTGVTSSDTNTVQAMTRSITPTATACHLVLVLEELTLDLLKKRSPTKQNKELLILHYTNHITQGSDHRLPTNYN